MRRNNIYILLLIVLSLSSCLKDNNTFIDPNIAINEQFTKDSILMSKFIVDNAIDTSGVRYGILYEIIEPGEGNHVFTANSTIEVKYKGRLLNGTIFDKTEEESRIFPLGGVIAGWQIGVPLIQKGGKIRLIIPSYYGYGGYSESNIPANSVLDFEIELIDVQ